MRPRSRCNAGFRTKISCCGARSLSQGGWIIQAEKTEWDCYLFLGKTTQKQRRQHESERLTNISAHGKLGISKRDHIKTI